MAIDRAPAPEPEPQAPQLYLLRLWPIRPVSPDRADTPDGPGEPAFRAALRPVGGAEPALVFTRPQQVGEFLSRAAAAPPQPEEPT